MQGASIFHLARGLYARDFFTARDIGRFAWAAGQVPGARPRGHGHRRTRPARPRCPSPPGHTVAELTSIGEEVFDEVMAAKVWPGTRALAQMHLDAGQRVWLVTATPVEVASVIARRLGLTGALGTVAETVDGVYTGRLVGEILHGEAKAEAVRALAEQEGLDLAACSAYSDSANDIPLLSHGRPALRDQPRRRLRAHAREHGWRVRDYRTGRKAAKVGLPAAAGLGAAAGAVAAGLSAAAHGALSLRYRADLVGFGPRLLPSGQARDVRHTATAG